MPSLTRQDLENHLIPLPPLPEQRAIARILRTVQQAREARQRELTLERERKAALMQHLFTHGTQGERTKQTEIGEMPESWEVVRLGQLLDGTPQNGLYKPTEYYGSGTPILRIDAFDAGDIIEHIELRRLRLSEIERANFALRAGDFVLNRVNGNVDLVGKCALICKLNELTVFESNMMRFRADSKRIADI